MTQKQRAILTTLAAAKSRGEVLTLDELIATLGVTSSKQAMQCSLAFLERRAYLERGYEVRAGRLRRILELTPSGYQLGSAL